MGAGWGRAAEHRSRPALLRWLCPPQARQEGVGCRAGAVPLCWVTLVRPWVPVPSVLFRCCGRGCNGLHPTELKEGRGSAWLLARGLFVFFFFLVSQL